MLDTKLPWTALPTSPPYVLPSDEALVTEFNARAHESARLRLEVIPEPFLGRPDAPVVLLNLNPGFVPEDVPHHEDPAFLSLARSNLAHAITDYPFFLLHPDVKAPGRKWWDQRLGPVLKIRTREAVARSVLCVEYFPYHSQKFRAGKLALPSQQYSFVLVREAIRRSATILLMRAESRWMTALPELGDYGRLLRLNSSQNVTISPKNCPRFAELIGSIG